jgi:hypothetical protein
VSYTLKLADGTVIGQDGHVVGSGAAPVVRSGAVRPDARSGVMDAADNPFDREVQPLVIAARRRIADLPDTPRNMSAINVVMGYSLFGLVVEEIATVTGLRVDQIEQVKASPAYGKMHDLVVNTVLTAESDNVRDMLAKNARLAAYTLVDNLSSGKRADRLSAAKEVLDRSGHRPVDVVEHRHSMDGGLRIEIVRKDDYAVMPTIELEETNAGY